MIILASNSNLRKLVLELSGLDFKVVTREVDERKIEEENPDKTVEEIAEILAVAKAKAVVPDFPDDVVIAADTFAILPDGTRLHKTESFEESIQLSMRQSGATMTVYTGTAMMYQGKIITNLTTTKITYHTFDEATVRHLFNVNEFAKRRHAALGFFVDAPGFTLIKKIEGSYLGAMGLPMDVVRDNLVKIGYK